ncbi:MAG: Na(+)-translocating NADH-quinone reductase subunit A [Bacteroidales bacterium]|nr:Na(+)-translocating NADH-quinone reductase subunit A [Bacteroidales bacterium]
MSLSVKLSKGLDIKIIGKAERLLAGEVDSALYGVRPVDFPGLIPKLNVKPGDRVSAGSPIFHDKIRPEIIFASPVSGTVVSVIRGDRRKLMEIVIEKNGNDYIDFGIADPSVLSREKIRESLLVSGLWPVVRQRPYHIVANPQDVPKAIFISGFDTSPLAPDYNFIMDNSSESLFRRGITALKKLTDGKINLVLNGKGDSSAVLKNASDVEISQFSGPHPAGNVGIQIHHLDPLNKGEIVWFVNLQDVLAIGRLFEEGRYNHERIVALTGSEIMHPQYYRIKSGVSVSSMTNGNVKPGNLRYISGNVLTGTSVGQEGHVGFYDSQVTVIPEGDYFEFFGWMKPGLDKFSFSRTFASKLIPSKGFRLDTNLHGGERAFVMTGQYEKVVPMDIYPMQLLKAILSEDIEMMENLGIYEIAEEDFALCEYICPSKIEIQSIVRKGLEMMIKEMN